MMEFGFSRLMKITAVAVIGIGASLTGTFAKDWTSVDDFNVETIASELDFPWGLTFLPDGDMLVTELSGSLRIIRNGQLDPKPVAGVPAVYRAGQGGLFEVELHPDFEANNLVYLSYAHGTSDANGTRIAVAKFDGEALSDLRVLFTPNWLKDTANHYGGRMTFLNDRTLILTLGDGYEYREMSQQLSNHIGTLVRLNDDGSIPKDNPFVGQGDALPEIWSYGHRNPQGIYYDQDNDILYQNEHGPRGGDEINIIQKGNNYGWPIATYGIDYSGALISPYTEYEGTVQPLLQWTPSIAPSSMTMYKGSLFPEWDGDLLVSALAARSLVRVDMKDGKAINQTVMLKDLGERIREVSVGPDGSLYLLIDGRNGKVLRLTPK